MSKRSPELLLEDILEAIEKIERFTVGYSKEQFESDAKTADAVIRNLEIIGEAANRIPEDFQNKHSDVAWNQIIGLRHRIVHDYFGIDLEIIWSILKNDLPTLKMLLLNKNRTE